MTKVIEVNGLSKAYQLGEVGTGTLSRDAERYWAKLRGKEDPFLKIGEENDRTTKSTTGIVWSLKDVSFDIEEGDAVGIIGRNGAGKSTLLKILSRITSPTSGSVKLKGRVASLLEVGTGFHAELSGRENIFLNGSILGMRKAEIKRKFDEIVDFAGVERYVDTPVKRYSSGMYVRLAFAVAAYLESEILIVDEVLSVGDAEFQRKCLGKMNQVSRGEGRTVLFVSHNMGAIQRLCSKGIILNNGKVASSGTAGDSIRLYTQTEGDNSQCHYVSKSREAVITQIDIYGKDKTNQYEFEFDQELNLNLLLRLTGETANAFVSMKVIDNLDRVIFTSERKIQELATSADAVGITIAIPGNLLTPGSYRTSFAVHIPNIKFIDIVENKISFEILETGSSFYQYHGADYGCVFVDCKWTAK